MCTVSMIMDHYQERWRVPYYPVPQPTIVPIVITPEEVAEFRRLLERARKYDRDHGEPDCELDEKRQALKKIAEQMGIDISFVDAPLSPT